LRRNVKRFSTDRVEIRTHSLCSARNKSANKRRTAKNVQNYRMYCIEQNRSAGGVWSHGSANMRQPLKSVVLDALKGSQDLESLKMAPAIDPEIVLPKQHLYTTIAKLEKQNFADYEYELSA
jgi:hypothetical protein